MGAADTPDTPATYRRYEIATEPARDLVAMAPRFRVRVRRGRLIRLVLQELVQLRFDLRVALSRPCVYGVFSGPVGGLRPREERCVGCLRCTVQHPDVVQIHRNPRHASLRPWDLTPDQLETVLYEARTGRVPVRGAGYRGPFGGAGWDGIWLDMSEIVRPTRDGIHGREFISTAVDVGEKPRFLSFAGADVGGQAPRVLTLQLPFLFEAPPAGPGSGPALEAVAASAGRLQTLALVPVEALAGLEPGPHLVPVVGCGHTSSLQRLPVTPMLALAGWDRSVFADLRRRFPERLVCVRIPAGIDVLEPVQAGARVLYLAADSTGHADGRHLSELARAAHQRLVAASVREEVTLLGGGGLVLAEHVAKAIVCGLDAVVLDVPLWVVMHGRPAGGFPRFDRAWAERRLRNLCASWRDQLLEVLGAMGMRDIRRLRGELGRCMFQRELEREAFGEVASGG